MADLRSRAAHLFARFAESCSGPPLIATHHDADGLSAGALLARAWEERFGVRPELRIVGRGENAWDDDFAGWLEGREMGGLVVADLGLAERRLAPGVPLCVVDHHVPTGAPTDATVLSGYEEDPVPSTSVIAFWCAEGLLGEEAADHFLWLSAIGLLGDYGDKAGFAIIADAKKRYRAGKLREATSLVNAPRRSASGDARPALALLMKASDPADVVSGDHPEHAVCEAARQEVNAAVTEARRQPPRFGSRYGAAVAIVRTDSPCQVHPLIAQSWVGRLRGATVFAANAAFEPGQVNFSGRGGRDADIVSLLARHRPDGADPRRYGNGHRRAAGGALSFPEWNAFCDDLGFGPEVKVEG